MYQLGLVEAYMVFIFSKAVEFYDFVSHGQEKRLRVNMRLKKLQEKVKEHQEKVGEKVKFLLIYMLAYLFPPVSRYILNELLTLVITYNSGFQYICIFNLQT